MAIAYSGKKIVPKCTDLCYYSYVIICIFHKIGPTNKNWITHRFKLVGGYMLTIDPIARKISI